MQRSLKTVSFRLSKEELNILREMEAHYNVKGESASDKFRALLHAWDEDQVPASMRWGEQSER